MSALMHWKKEKKKPRFLRRRERGEKWWQTTVARGVIR